MRAVRWFKGEVANECHWVSIWNGKIKQRISQ